MADLEISNTFNDVCVLHLSDLHIIFKSGRKYDSSLELLIWDIKEQLERVDELILVVSGDIIDKGQYCQKNKEAALSFFDDLMKALGGKIKDLIMVPGNHDKIRDSVNDLITLKSQDDEDFLKEKEWGYQLNAFSDFIELYNMLLRKYFPKNDAIENTFGVHHVVLGGYNLIFVRLDTAWCSCSNDDSFKLRLGKFQAEKLVEEYQACLANIKDSKLLTIGISHFPIGFLNPKEEAECNKLFLSRDKLNLDILLCGHVHDVSLAHYFNHEHSLLTLVTGIGGINPNNSKEGHRYSIYLLNLINNSCDIIMRKSGKTCFNFDYSIYTGQESIKDNKIVYPIKVTESHPFIKLFAPNPIQTKSKFLDSNLLKLIPLTSRAIDDFIQSIALAMIMYKARAYDDIRAEMVDENGDYYNEESAELASRIYEYLFLENGISKSEEEYLIYEDVIVNFSGFLMDICGTLIRCIKMLFHDDVIIRTHFRIYDEKRDSYIALACQTNEKKESTSPKNIQWTRIMQAAFHSGEVIQLSANPKLNDVETTWEDFLTIVPKCLGNSLERMTDGTTREHEQRPCLTFGLSIKKAQPEDINVLSLLSFLKLDVAITKAIDEYLVAFKIDLRKSLNDMLNNVYEQRGNNYETSE